MMAEVTAIRSPHPPPGGRVPERRSAMQYRKDGAGSLLMLDRLDAILEAVEEAGYEARPAGA